MLQINIIYILFTNTLFIRLFFFLLKKLHMLINLYKSMSLLSLDYKENNIAYKFNKRY